MKEIRLTQGKVALIDDADFEWLSQWKWRCSRHFRTWYAMRTVHSLGKTMTVSMHRLITGAKPGEQVDHVDGNGINNQRNNLRFVTTWGAFAEARRRWPRVVELLDRPLLCLATTADGMPKHPLYLRADLLPITWEPPRRAVA